MFTDRALIDEYQHNPVTGDARISDMAASLCGIAAALDAAIDRLLVLYSVVFSFGGIPLVYMGDELALGNDRSWATTPHRHGTTVGSTVRPWTGPPPNAERTPARPRRACMPACAPSSRRGREAVALGGGGETTVFAVGDESVLAHLRRHPRSGPLVAVANFNDNETLVPMHELGAAAMRSARVTHAAAAVRSTTRGTCACRRGGSRGSRKRDGRSALHNG